MNYPGHDSATDPWCFPDDDAAATAAGGGDMSSSFFADVIAGASTDHLFELVVQGQGGGVGAPRSATMMPPVVESCRLRSPPPFKPSPPEVRRFDPPSDDEMAAWLHPIVKGEDLAFNDDDGGRDVPAAKGSTSGAVSTTTTSDTKEKLAAMTGVMGTKQEIRKPPPAARESSRRSHHAEAHSLTEKRRRHKINERLRTLQQLVPGCEKSNQASTLDQTIQYLRTLQHHVQEMSGVGPAPPPPAPAVPVVPPPRYYAPPMRPVAVPTMMPAAPMVLAAPASTTMVPFGAMVQLPHPHYPAAAVMMPAAAAAPLYPAAVAPGNAESSASHRRRHGSNRSKSRSSSLRLKR